MSQVGQWGLDMQEVEEYRLERILKRHFVLCRALRAYLVNAKDIKSFELVDEAIKFLNEELLDE